MAAAGWFYLELSWLSFAVAVCIGIFFVCIDVLSPRRKLAVFSGVLFGLVVGILIAYGLSFPITMLMDQGMELIKPHMRSEFIAGRGPEFVKLMVALVTCYLTISFTLQSKDDFRFIIPYVEFKRNTRGSRPFLLDTSVLIDGRIADVIDTGLIDAQVVIPRFILAELQDIADSGDRLKRNRGRRGLEILARLRNNPRVDVNLYEATVAAPGEGSADQRLVDLAIETHGRLLTTDYNLNKVAQLRGIDVINLNDLAKAVKAVVIPGEKMSVRLVKAGESPGQGVGYLDDGTMVVVEQGKSRLNEQVDVTVTSALQTSAGRMIFAKIIADGTGAATGGSKRDAATEVEA
jgi:uncharacterized protein YacL